MDTKSDLGPHWKTGRQDRARQRPRFSKELRGTLQALKPIRIWHEKSECFTDTGLSRFRNFFDSFLPSQKTTIIRKVRLLPADEGG